ncbi:GNAT family N-acetyltransferase [Bacillus sp. PS06]|uniref:GNAT family N-acetyltransferase n=1 Tax=Bacillus sp. PS06 TaxID=2764176 RepID=UPI001783F390|nr:GNAT family N-acetyltransferase [Bacillus sp. PS06]MBD8071563.1 GNAT family N-acetyltransferase [Bacillus sp. PS06]
MITELKVQEFTRCEPLLNENGQLEVKAVIQGMNPGRVFVDHPLTPTTGFIWLGNNDGFIFFGNENNDKFNDGLELFFNRVIIPDATKVGVDWFEGIGNHPNWDSTIERVFQTRRLGSWKQRVYSLHKNDFETKVSPSISRNYEVVKITESLFENKDQSIKNSDFLHSPILENWSTVDLFLRHGLAYGVISNQEIVSLCYSGFVARDVHSIGIVTLEEHRGQKLAQSAAFSYVSECLELGITPYWDCMDSNKPSIAIAERLGFKPLFTYKGYEYPLQTGDGSHSSKS